MKKFRNLLSFSAFALVLTVGVSLSAQQSAPPATSPDPATPQTQTTDPASTPQAQPGDQTATPQTQPSQPSQPADPAAQPSPRTQSQPDASATDAQSFSGTIVKSGNKYVLQDADSGKTYDIDHQEQVKPFEGKKVRVHGTLDASTNTIHVQ